MNIESICENDKWNIYICIATEICIKNIHEKTDAFFNWKKAAQFTFIYLLLLIVNSIYLCIY